MIAQLFYLLSLFALSRCYSVQKYVSPCGITYSTGTLSYHGIRSVLHEMIPKVIEVLQLLRTSHHKMIEEYGFKKTWIPDDSSLISTKSPINIAKQLPDIYKSFLAFSYALDLVFEDNTKHENSEMCFFFIDSLPNIIGKHRELVCATDSAMRILKIEIPQIDIINLPNDWAQPQGTSCVDKFFRFSETHFKYRKFLTALQHLLHI